MYMLFAGPFLEPCSGCNLPGVKNLWYPLALPSSTHQPSWKTIFWIESSKLTQARKKRTFAQSWICFFDHMFMICCYIRLYQFPKSGNGSTAHLCNHGVHQQFPKKNNQPKFLYQTHVVTRRFNIPIISSGCSSKFVCHVYVRI